MKILIQSAKIIDPNSSAHQKTRNILIENGRIADVSTKTSEADRIIQAEGMLLSPGWFDLGTQSGEPGFEQKEDLESLAQAAMAGGFTELAVLPNTQPVVQTKADVNYFLRGNAGRLVQMHVLAAVTRNTRGEDFTEMMDLHHAGAIGFTDGLKTIWNTDIFLKTLQYLQAFNGLLVDHPEDIWLNLYGQMNESPVSARLGLKGMPALAEEIALSRNLKLLGYAGGRLHISRISTARAVSLLRTARKKLAVTCDVAAYQPLLDDSLLESFDTNYKVNPPLRQKRDNDALIRGLQDGTIDVICSGHVPQDEESKMVEFDHAEAGIISLQTTGSNLSELSSVIPWDVLIEKIAINPRKVLGLQQPVIEEGEKANLTLFDPGAEWTLDETTNKSKSKNSPWWGKKVKGKTIAVFNNGRYRIFE
ncbi:MAG: dihydroorotase [Cyclobacteriaceae bacterium]|nr:dihydroorotase [Cyclobacteriaceae bacterium]MDW8331632.1 dihydroorotase [Cyclobacteriaceae bacterium]